mmetsp:Transcript_277/g.505  ORF Transcript_277/g.505 Transcript_277/m.505 type:complete len:295 (-) Transcript_277:600-1484(-)
MENRENSKVIMCIRGGGEVSYGDSNASERDSFKGLSTNRCNVMDETLSIIRSSAYDAENTTETVETIPTQCKTEPLNVKDQSSHIAMSVHRKLFRHTSSDRNATLLKSPPSPVLRKRKQPNSASRSRRRKSTSYDLHTGMVAHCNRCGKLGKYRQPTTGRAFQHSTGEGRYCGYFNVDPRPGSLDELRAQKTSSSPVPSERAQSSGGLDLDSSENLDIGDPCLSLRQSFTGIGIAAPFRLGSLEAETTQHVTQYCDMTSPHLGRNTHFSSIYTSWDGQSDDQFVDVNLDVQCQH